MISGADPGWGIQGTSPLPPSPIVTFLHWTPTSCPENTKISDDLATISMISFDLRISGGWGSLVRLKLLDALGKRMDHFMYV